MRGGEGSGPFLLIVAGSPEILLQVWRPHTPPTFTVITACRVVNTCNCKEGRRNERDARRLLVPSGPRCCSESTTTWFSCLGVTGTSGVDICEGGRGFLVSTWSLHASTLYRYEVLMYQSAAAWSRDEFSGQSGFNSRSTIDWSTHKLYYLKNVFPLVPLYMFLLDVLKIKYILKNHNLSRCKKISFQ